jgi:acetyl-CoA carboxylase carboxyltransferase component
MMSPAVFSGIEGKTETYSTIGGAENHRKDTGIAHCTCKTDDECFESAKRLLSFLPDNNLDGVVSTTVTDDLNRIDEVLNTIVPEGDEAPVDMKYIIQSVADNGDFYEIHEGYAENITAGFIKLGGISAGVIATVGKITIDSCFKTGEFVNICDAFNIPIITLTDVDGYKRDYNEEQGGIISYAAKILYTFANATVPKINLIVRNGIGNPYLIMNSKHIGADIVFAWPSAKIALMSKEAQVKVLGTSSEEYDEMSSPYAVAEKGYIDGIITPSGTRKYLISAVEMLLTKRESKPARKHSSIEF